MITARAATQVDLPAFIDSVDNLFRDDAGVYGTYTDLTWPVRQGPARYAPLVDDPSSLLLVACSESIDDHAESATDAGGQAIIGHLFGHISEPTATRQPVRFAVLESIYIDEDFRKKGAGGLLTGHFLAWAKEQNCVEAIVEAYVANEAAQRFYARRGFDPRSLTLGRAL